MQNLTLIHWEVINGICFQRVLLRKKVQVSVHDGPACQPPNMWDFSKLYGKTTRVHASRSPVMEGSMKLSAKGAVHLIKLLLLKTKQIFSAGSHPSPKASLPKDTKY